MVLRVSCAVLLVVAQQDVAPVGPFTIVALGLAAALVLGLFTPLVAGLCAIFALWAWFQLGGAPGILIALHGLDAAALGLLGAGAYSVDARLFGRRVLRLKT